LKISSDVFQQRLDSVIQNIDNVTGIADDCLAFGDTIISHDIALLKLLHSARLNGIKFNPDKMQFRTQECHFFGEILTSQGMVCDPKKVQAIKAMTPPEDKLTLSSFLGLVNYMKRYSSVLSELCKPLRQLLKEDSVWSWQSNQQLAFEQIKDILTNTPILTYYSKDAKSHIIQTDASLKGLGGVLLQDGKPVQYISRTLTKTEENYSSIERELLGVVFGLERLHNYVYGGPVKVQTDHKPLESLFHKNVSEISPRLQRLMLRLHKYDITLEYLKG
jgi:hypothetical protein